ncbi:MAG: tRNA adenosine(34) deaminase TadA [Burkholderiaceae bacterium]|nr:tRNA adenosine(34) deaminase TadA [Burkholderiaceae bacterium]MCD8516777.1 tRNA adenosine(34) deaminase TadA [Burkholderiaceae bacterium]MCD8564394.1 tRNA adenosine(34) deaminase TadA [Burkholderiaceae bacterium]
MLLALEQAKLAQARGEVPVGAVLVDAQGCVLGLGANAVIGLSDPTAHAEIVALREAANQVGNYRLPDTTLYVTLEPCAMCLGALFHARVGRIVFGAYDPKTGACGSKLDLTTPDLINFHAQVQGGVLGQTCGQLLSDFFKEKRRLKSLSDNVAVDDTGSAGAAGDHGN